MSSRQAVFLLALVAAVALGTVLRLGTRAQLVTGDRVHALTSDDNYHLRRARFAVAHYPRTILFDPLMNFPRGGVPIWPPLFDVTLATPARVLHGPGAPADAIERGAAWVPIFFAAGAVILAGLFGHEVFGTVGGIALAFFVAVCPGHILWTQYGHTDQHVAESFFGLLVLWLFLRSRNRPGETTTLWETATGIALALATLVWQGAIYWGAILALSLLLESVLTRRGVLRAAVLVLGLPASLAAGATLWWLDGFRPPLTYISFGLFQPLFLAALAGGTILLDSILASARGRLSPGQIVLRLTLLAAAAIAVLPNSQGVFAGLGRGLEYAAGKTAGEIATSVGYVSYPKNWLKGIFEARPLLSDGPGLAMRQLSLAFFLAPAAILLWAWRAVAGERPGLHVGLAVWGAVTLFLTLSQRMDVYYAAPLAGASLVETAAAAAGWLAKTRREHALVAAAVTLLLVAPFATSVPAEVRSVHAAGSDLYSTLDWMRRELPHTIDPYDPRLLSPTTLPPELDRAASVLAPWSLGHLILYESGLPVVANNFGYGFTDSLQFFLAETEEEALSIAHRRRARWVLATDLVPRLNDYAAYIGRPAPLRWTANGLLLPTERYFRTLQSRLYDFDGAGWKTPQQTVPPLAHFRLRFHSASAIRRGPRWIARWKVFEIVSDD